MIVVNIDPGDQLPPETAGANVGSSYTKPKEHLLIYVLSKWS